MKITSRKELAVRFEPELEVNFFDSKSMSFELSQVDSSRLK